MIREEGGWWILLYFKDQGSTSVLNAIKVHRTSSIESFEEDGEHSGLCFVIKMESGQMYLHRAPDPQSREKWLRALNLARTAGLQLVSLRKTILRNQNFCSDSHEWLSHNFILALLVADSVPAQMSPVIDWAGCDRCYTLLHPIS